MAVDRCIETNQYLNFDTPLATESTSSGPVTQSEKPCERRPSFGEEKPVGAGFHLDDAKRRE